MTYRSRSCLIVTPTPCFTQRCCPTAGHGKGPAQHGAMDNKAHVQGTLEIYTARVHNVSSLAILSIKIYPIFDTRMEIYLSINSVC